MIKISCLGGAAFVGIGLQSPPKRLCICVCVCVHGRMHMCVVILALWCSFLFSYILSISPSIFLGQVLNVAYESYLFLVQILLIICFFSVLRMSSFFLCPHYTQYIFMGFILPQRNKLTSTFIYFSCPKEFSV